MPQKSNRPEILKDIRALVEYNWQDELRDYNQQVRDGEDEAVEHHVFLALRRIDKWLGENQS